MGWESSYTGRSSYKYAERLISEGRDILIVSPYIDSYYAEFLLRNGRKKHIKIISSSVEREARKILGRKRSLGNFFATALLVLPLDYLSFTFSVLSIYVILASLLILSMAFYLCIHRKSDIELKIPREFVHAKIYISDGVAIFGSANLTYKGMHENIEHIEVREKENEVNRLKSEFWKIWNST